MEDAKGSRTKHLLECLGLVATLLATVTGIYVSLRPQPSDDDVTSAIPVDQRVAIETPTPPPSSRSLAIVAAHAGQPKPSSMDAAAIDPTNFDRFETQRQSIDTAKRQLQELTVDFPQCLFDVAVDGEDVDATSGGLVTATRLRLNPAAYQSFAQNLERILHSVLPEPAHGGLASHFDLHVRLASERGLPHMEWVDADRRDGSAWRQAWAGGEVSNGGLPQTLIILDLPNDDVAAIAEGTTLRGKLLVVAPELREPLLQLLHRFETLHLAVEGNGLSGSVLHRHQASVAAPMANTRSPLKWVTPLMPVGQRWSLDHSRLAPMSAFHETERSRTDVNDVLCLAPMMATLADRDLQMSEKHAARLRDSEAVWTTEVNYRVPLVPATPPTSRIATVSATLVF